MIIKQFAALCDCNPQTLRYYDSIDLLKPVRVDHFTGYRYYSAEQALIYLKIKKLQDAFFSIEEIKELLNASDEVVYEELNKKIAEQEAKLLNIKNIQKSYRKEMKEMKDKILKIREKLMISSVEVDYKDEFGITKDEYYEMIKAANQLLDNTISEGGIEFADVQEDIENIDVSGMEVAFQLTGFNKMKEAIDKIPALPKGEYLIHSSINEKYKDNIAYLNVIISMILEKTPGKDIRLEFSFEYSNETNFLTIYKR